MKQWNLLIWMNKLIMAVNKCKHGNLGFFQPQCLYIQICSLKTGKDFMVSFYNYWQFVGKQIML